MRWLLVALLAAGCNQDKPCFDRASTGWPEAEALFRGDPSWRGGDAAYSIPLGAGRVLWLFGDSFVAPSTPGTRAGSKLARNSIAITSSVDLTTANVKFHWRGESAFCAARDTTTWYWPGHGSRLGDLLLIFLWRMKAGGGLGFENDAPEAVLIANPDDDPSAWRMTPIAVPQNSWGVFLGTGAVIVRDGFLYSMSCVEPGNHDVYLARWPIDEAARGALDDPEWLTGGGWTRQSALQGAPMKLFSDGHTEFSVHHDGARFVQIQSRGFPHGEMVMRAAPALEGPWSAPRVVHTPVENACKNLLTYAGKAHPELRTPDGTLAVSYATNDLDFWALVGNQDLYFPRFARLTLP